MRSKPENRMPKSAVTVWRIGGLLRSLFLWLLPVILWVVRLNGSGPHLWIIFTSAAAVFLYTIFAVILAPIIRWRRWKYQVNEHEIDLLRGIFVVRRTLIPVNRVQHVDTRRGPVLRKFGLSNVTISTAATTHEIPALDRETADRVRDQISNFARLAKEDV